MDKHQITKEELKQAWLTWAKIILLWNAVSATAVLSTVVIWNFILKNYLGYKTKMPTCNDTEPTFIEGDFGAKWWLKKNNLKPGLWSAFLWWIRNHSWNFISRFMPHWAAGSVDKNALGYDEFWVIKCTLEYDKDYGRWTRAHKKKKIYGLNYFAYRIDGVVYFQWSYASKWIQIQLGAGGKRYRINIKF